MKFSKLLNSNGINKQQAFILGMIYAWPIFSKDEKVVLAYSSYRITNSPKMKVILKYDQKHYINEHFNKLSNFLGNNYAVVKNSDTKNMKYEFDKKIGNGVSILFDNDISKENIYGIIEKQLIDAEYKIKQYFLSGFMDGRGSLDFTANYYTIDIAEKLPVAKRKLHILNDILGMIYNFNSRALQDNSHNKNDQLRITLDYFAGRYGFFRPHIIEYYEEKRNIKLKESDKYFFVDDRFTDKELPKNANYEINNFAILLDGLTKDEKLKKLKKYKTEIFDFDTDDEILYSNFNVKKAVKANANYTCEYDNQHSTFTSKTTGKNYVEAHHLIPFSKRKDFEVSIDIEENLVALCPNCHRLIHLAQDNKRVPLLKNLFNSKKNKLQKQIPNIDITILCDMYNVEK